MDSDEIIEVLGNKYNPEILDAASEPKSAQELSDELDVPIATCYRRINELTEVDLLELHDQPLSEEHRRIKVYRRCIDEVSIDFRDGLDIDLQQRSDVKNTLDEVWRRTSRG
ncbi:MAG: helix-turn-helix domain-containing protein [Halolamina sp.]|jgi:predicted transcriptional regulator|uniref:winged helix-turn-helix domain-containing protein n=1 Tax=Halolamina sp. TaxID=1940283 RepID=UPI002FC3B994